MHTKKLRTGEQVLNYHFPLYAKSWTFVTPATCNNLYHCKQKIFLVVWGILKVHSFLTAWFKNIYQSISAFRISFYLDKGLLLSFYDEYTFCLVRNSVNSGELSDFSNVGWNLISPLFFSTVTCQIHYLSVSCVWNSKYNPNNISIRLFKRRNGICLQIFAMEPHSCQSLWKIFWDFFFFPNIFLKANRVAHKTPYDLRKKQPTKQTNIRGWISFHRCCWIFGGLFFNSLILVNKMCVLKKLKDFYRCLRLKATFMRAECHKI